MSATTWQYGVETFYDAVTRASPSNLIWPVDRGHRYLRNPSNLQRHDNRQVRDPQDFQLVSASVVARKQRGTHLDSDRGGRCRVPPAANGSVTTTERTLLNHPLGTCGYRTHGSTSRRARGQCGSPVQPRS